MITGDDVCESLAAEMVAVLQSGSPANVTVRWGFSLKADDSRPAGLFVDLFPDPESPVQTAVKIRRGDGWDHAILAIVWEVCPPGKRNKADETVGEPGKPSRDWMREKLRWAMTNVFRRFSDERDGFVLEVRDLDTGEITELVPQEATVISQYDPAFEERGCFAAQFRFTFREQE